MIWNSLQVLSSYMRQRLFFQNRPQLAMLPQLDGLSLPQHASWMEPAAQEDNPWIWFAVPKRKHTRSRKRMKTTVHKRLPLKKNIVFDPRTGEVTLKHKLPLNWKDYLPKEE